MSEQDVTKTSEPCITHASEPTVMTEKNEPETDKLDTTGPMPPRPLPDFVDVFCQSARLLDGLPHEDKDRVLKALSILFEVKL